MFDELYESCFKNTLLIRIFNEKSTKKAINVNDSELSTLDKAFNGSQFVLFYLISSSSDRATELIGPIKQLISSRNENSVNSKSSPARFRRIFSKKSKKRKMSDQKELCVIVLDLDACGDSVPENIIGEVGWFIFAPLRHIEKSRLLRSLQYQSTPSLVVVDSFSRQIITTDGRRLIQEDCNGNNFPWWNPTADELFQGTVLKNFIDEDGTRKISSLEYKNLSSIVKGLYFGANWCPPCKTFTKQLISCYESLKNAGVPFEIFFCSSDRSRESFEHHFASMPWLALDYDMNKLTSLTRLYGVHGIPAFLILDEENRVITRHGRNVMLNDPCGKSFPWKPQPIYELNEYTLCRLRDEPSLILFTEGSPEDVSFSNEVLKSTADALFSERNEYYSKRCLLKDAESHDENGNGNESGGLTQSSNSVDSSASDISVPCWADPLQIFYTGEDPICDLVLEGLGLADAELPLIVIVDVIGGYMTTCGKPDVSAEIVKEFVAEYKASHLQIIPLPLTCQSTQFPSQVGGIPIRAIHQALGISNSTSQNSVSIESFGLQKDVKGDQTSGVSNVI